MSSIKWQKCRQKAAEMSSKGGRNVVKTLLYPLGDKRYRAPKEVLKRLLKEV